MKLCTYSKSEIHYDKILDSCPLGLSQTKARKCECRKRVYHVPPGDLRVLSCTYPDDWRGRPVVTNEVEIDMGDEAKLEPTEVEAWQKLIDELWGTVNGMPLKIRAMGATGPFGSGKSLLGDMIDPRHTLKIDLESSSTAFNLPFKKHLVMYDEVPTKNKSGIPSAMECFVWFRGLVESIEPCEYTVVSVDPINEIQQGAYDYVVAHPEEFGRTAGQYEKMTALAWGDVKTMLDMLVGSLSKKIGTFYYTLHMGQVWKGGKPVEGKMKAKGSDVFRKMADVLFVLDRPIIRTGKDAGKQVAAPTGMIGPPIGKSRLAHVNVNTGEIQPILPPVIPNLTPAKIREFIAKPQDVSNLGKQYRVVEEHMSEDDKLLLKAEIAENEKEAEELRLQRLQGAKEAQQKIQEAKKKSATEQKKPSQSETSKPEEKPAEALVPSTADVKLSKPDRIAIIKESATRLWGAKAVPTLKKAVQKRGGDGAKLVDLSEEHLIEIHTAIASRMSSKEEGDKAVPF